MNIDTDDLKRTFNRIWKPALAGAAGSGVLSSYLASKDHDPMETPRERRHRILRNALIGTALGGAAGVAIPEGARMLGTPFFGDGDSKPPLLERAFDKGITETGKHALPLGVLAGGGTWIARNRHNNQEHALSHLFSDMGETFEAPGGRTIKDTKGLKALMESNPGMTGSVVEKARAGVLQRPGTTENDRNLFSALDRLNEAGFRRNTITPEGQFKPEASTVDLILHALGKKKLPASSMHSEAESAALGDWLSQQGPVSKLVSDFSPKRMVDKGGAPVLDAEGLQQFEHLPAMSVFKHKLNLEALPEIYRRLVRPSVKGRLGIPLQLGLLGGAALGANTIQKRVLGE